MKPVEIEPRKPMAMTQEQWLADAFDQINNASRERPEVDVPNAFTVTDLDIAGELTEFNADTATDAEVRRVLATLIVYYQKQGPDRAG